ncbi:HinT-interacting membrane complex lipoprotein P60 [Mycoplasmopsis adleri]|uniref:HinT-interacting membrane complex lipoprotein P60 n=1 Tax=Mycoplasmopsis adleri TaxID=51362 RepID=UPI003873558D
MKKLRLLGLGSVIAAGAMSALSVSCKKNEIETPARIDQFNFLSSQERVKDLEQIWKTFALSNVYKLNQKGEFNEAALNKKFDDTFNDASSQLYKDSWEAFLIYANSKLENNSNYWINQFSDWNKNNLFDDKEVEWIEEGMITEDLFKTIWKVNKTGIREEINNMLLVKAYFAISSLNELKKITKEATNKEFQYYFDGNDVKYDLDHYYLNQYAMNNKYIQLWSLEETKSDDLGGNEIFLGNTGQSITNVESYNAFFEKFGEQKNTKMANWQALTTPDLTKIDLSLSGFKGFQKDNTSFNLNWNEKDMLERKDDRALYGVYSPIQNTLFNFNEIQTSGQSVSVFNETSHKLEVAYVNQIVPIGGKDKIKVAKDKEVFNKEKSKWTAEDQKEVSVLSLKNTIYKDHLDRLSFMFYLKDSSKLLELAIGSFAHLGIKLTINKNIPQVYDLVKDKIWVNADKKDAATTPEK